MTTTTETTEFEVGGCVRDDLMGIRSKDVDFVVIAESFDAMRADLIRRGFKIHVEKPEFVTIRAGVPEGDPLRARTRDADFVLARKDSTTSDGRRPDFVEAGTLMDDLARRDFTMNAIARTIGGDLVDPFGGVADIENRVLRFVGDPEDRIREDGLRVIRGFRFMVMKGVTPTPLTGAAMASDLAVEMLAKVSTERIRDEVDRMLAFDTRTTLDILSHAMRPEMLDVMFGGGLRLAATMKG
jgi:tRNA nucleotidyltransferase (CCA-adding enzyme)